MPEPKGIDMDQKLNRCAYGAWHYGDQLCEVCRKAAEGPR